MVRLFAYPLRCSIKILSAGPTDAGFVPSRFLPAVSTEAPAEPLREEPVPGEEDKEQTRAGHPAERAVEFGGFCDKTSVLKKQFSDPDAPSDPPPPHPKPENILQKLEQTSRPPSPSTEDNERVTPARSHESTAHASESTWQDVGLKEWVDDLQGCSDLVNPLPGPVLEELGCENSPMHVKPLLLTEERPVSSEVIVDSPHLDSGLTETQVKKPTESMERGDDGSVGDSEEERQSHRVGIVHAQRLEGDKVEVAPSAFAPKSPVRQSSVWKDEIEPGTDCVQ